MARFGSKAMQSRRPGTDNSMENPQMGGEGSGTMRDGKKKKNKNRRPAKEHHGTDAKRGSKESSYQVDPETTKYFTEIANLLEGTEMDVEERPAICGNALEETRGKESEVATDYILSHTLQTLLEGCDVDSLCGFLQRCVDNFLYIAMDRSGSHVVETALKSLSLHGNEGFTFVDETLTKICQASSWLTAHKVGGSLVQLLITSVYNHEKRGRKMITLLLSNGESWKRRQEGKGHWLPRFYWISLEFIIDTRRILEKRLHFLSIVDALEDFHTTKKSATLVKRLSTNAARSSGNISRVRMAFELLKFSIVEIFEEWNITLPPCGLIKTTALRLLVGEDQELMQIIRVLIGFHDENVEDQNLKAIVAQDMVKFLLDDNAYSHLMEMDLIWVELGGKFKELLEIGRAGVVASILAASQRLQCYGQKEYIQSFAASISSMESGHVLETAKNAGEHELQGYFGELAMHPSGSFLVEKCFSSSNMPLKETIAAELSVVRFEISKTKQGPYLLRKLDIEE
ncbi:hypothetical protein Scep_012041 [Stephania cephalantha]|uniref:Uncharacterized protein n=1 Tax=Stephania cephalantha TaxID=152367 RepID=A0AAP0JG88_9MAGN